MKRALDETTDETTDDTPTPTALPIVLDRKYVFFVGNDDDRPVRAHEDELSKHSLFSSLAQHRGEGDEAHRPIPVACSRDVLRSLVAFMRTNEVMILGDTTIEELFETMRATCLLDNPFNVLLELDTDVFVQYFANSGFSTAVTTEFDLQKSERATRRTRLLWTQLAHSIRNWPALRRAMRECARSDSPVFNHVSPGAARIHINTSINDQGRQFILRCLCEIIAVEPHPDVETPQNEQSVLERFADETFVDHLMSRLLKSTYGPFWFIRHEPTAGRSLKLDKKIKRLTSRIMNELSTDLEEQTVVGVASTRLRKLWEGLCLVIPRLEAYFGLCEEEDTNEMRLLKEVFNEHGIKLVKHERARRTVQTQRLLCFPTPDVHLDSIEAVVTLHFK